MFSTFSQHRIRRRTRELGRGGVGGVAFFLIALRVHFHNEGLSVKRASCHQKVTLLAAKSHASMVLLALEFTAHIMERIVLPTTLGQTRLALIASPIFACPSPCYWTPSEVTEHPGKSTILSCLQMPWRAVETGQLLTRFHTIMLVWRASQFH